jgi:hypothetical protein
VSSFPLPVGSYQLPAPQASCRRLINCYPQLAPPEKPNGQPVTLVRAPGIRAFSVTTALHNESEVRGGIMMGGVLYVVADDKVYSVTSQGVATALSGDAITGSGPVRIEINQTPTMFITNSAGDGYTSDGATVAEITDPDFTSGNGGADPVFLDGFIAFRRPGTAQIFNTGLNTTAINALDIATAEGAPDNVVGLLANGRELIIPGEKSTERWYNAGNSPGSPFSRSPQGFYEIGCAAGGSLANQDNAPVMLANDLTFRRLGGSWERISHDGIDSILQRMTLRSDCIAIPYRQEGHHFVAFTFRNAGRTLVVDFNTGEWHERDSIVSTVNIGYWRPSCIIEAYGYQIVGDSQSGRLGILDPDTHEEFGEPQRVSWTYSPIYADRNLVSLTRFSLGVSCGEGTATGQGQNPLATLFLSQDGGNVFDARPTRSLGRLGEYQKVIQWRNNGSARQFVARVEVTDPVRLFVLDTQIEATGLRQ